MKMFKHKVLALGIAIAISGTAYADLSDGVELIRNGYFSSNLEAWEKGGSYMASNSPYTPDVSIIDDSPNSQALKMNGVSGGNYYATVAQEVNLTSSFSSFNISFDWKVTEKEPTYGATYINIRFLNEDDVRIGQVSYWDTGRSDGHSLSYWRGNLEENQFVGVRKYLEVFDWENVSVNTLAMTGMEPSQVAKISVGFTIQNDAGQGGVMLIDNFSIIGNTTVSQASEQCVDTQTQVNEAKATGVQEGIDQVKGNPSDYNLFTQAQVNEAKTTGVQEGIAQVKDNPSDYDLFTQAKVNEAKTTGIQEGIDTIKGNPSDYDLFTLIQIDDAKATALQEGKAIGVQEGIDQVKNDPNKYDLLTQAQVQTQVDEAKNAGVQEGIKAVQNNPDKYGLFAQAQVDEAKAAGVQEGIKEVQNNPKKYGLFTQAQVDEVKKTASQEAINEVKTNPSDYGLLTQNQVDEASEKGERTGIDKVTSNPNEYELFTQAQVDEAKEIASQEGIDEGIDKVTSNPNDYELIPKTVILTGSGTYLVGDMLDIKLEVSIEASHLQQVDLWVIIQLPEALGDGFIYMTDDPFNLFDPSPTPFKRSLQHLEKTYPILSFEVPPNFGGEYILYAFFTQEGSGLDSLFSTLRSSNVAETTVIFSNR